MRRSARAVGLLALTVCVAACGTRKSLHANGRPDAAAQDGGGDVVVAADGRDAAAEPTDPGYVPMRRLSDAEYANTVQDLFGLTGLEGELLASVSTYEGPVSGFDNLAGFTSVSPQRLERYFATAVLVAETAFADPQARNRVLVCSPDTDERPCIRKIVELFGQRAWRRLLTPEEMDGLVALVSGGRAAGEDFATAVQRAVVAMLVSESFLFRVELDPPDVTATVHPLTGFEIASRLSYLLWSTMPDEHLFSLAVIGSLNDPPTLTAEVTRMLTDPRARGFERDFLGQWLGFRDLYGPTLSRPGADWSVELQVSMAEEVRLFVDELLKEDADLSELLTRKVHFVDWRLSQLYDFSPIGGPGEAPVRTVPKYDQRGGYLGFAAPLTLSSYSTTTSPAVRGGWVLERFLCLNVPDALPDLHWVRLPPSDTPRERSDMISKMPSCGPCHRLLDGVGLSLEHFDQVGIYRERYPDPPASAHLIDTNGVLPPDVPFNGVTGLETTLANDPRFYRCAARKALTYAVGRRFDETEDARIDAVAAAWARGTRSLRALLAAVVVDDTFRYRRAGTP